MRIKIVEAKLGRERAVGQCFHGENLIEIDPRQSERERLDTVIHEVLHLCCPEWTEEQVVRVSKVLSAVLWKCRYRRFI
jgi:hypothetical protein